MSDGETAIASAEPGVPAIVEAEVVPQEAVIETPPVEEFHEIEFDGEKYSVPKKLRDGFLMQSDYTRKTQSLADERKAVEAQREAVKQQQEAAVNHAKDIGRVYHIDDQIAELEKTDWSALEQEDFFKAQARFRELTLLKDQRARLVAQIQDNEQKRSQETQQSFAKRYAETNETLADPVKGIPGWNQELANNLRDFAMANGASEDDIRTLAVNAPLVKLLHKAFLGDELVKKQQAAAKTVEPKPAPKPLTKISGTGAKPAVSLADADMETYVAERKKQGFGR